MLIIYIAIKHFRCLCLIKGVHNEENVNRDDYYLQSKHRHQTAERRTYRIQNAKTLYLIHFFLIEKHFVGHFVENLGTSNNEFVKISSYIALI